MILIEGDSFDYYMTLGMSNWALRSHTSSENIYQEIILIVKKNQVSMGVQNVLYDIAIRPTTTGFAYLRGDTVDAPFPSISGKSHVYFSVPVYVTDGFYTYANDIGMETVFSWAIPVSNDERDFITRSGWEEFEDLLERENPALEDLLRPSIL